MSQPTVLLRSELPFPVRRGKVRDVYDFGQYLLIVATDRISAYDVVMPNGIPEKGKILTALSLHWFEWTKDICPNHFLTANVDDYPRELHKYRDQLEGRSMWVKKANVVPIECVARGFLYGTGLKEYEEFQTVCGILLPPGLKKADYLPKPLFSPATKEESGHDINITFEEMCLRVGTDLALDLREKTINIYVSAELYAKRCGVIIADTKFEFGRLEDGTLILVDEILTPDSSRFWPADKYQAGRDQDSFDKQYVRNWLEAQPWGKIKQPPAPELPPDVVTNTQAKYIEAYERITEKRWIA